MTHLRINASSGNKAPQFVPAPHAGGRTFTNPEATGPQVKNVLLFKVAEQTSVVLVVWASDRNCEKGCCEFSYSLDKIGSEGRLHQIGENLYGCDVCLRPDAELESTSATGTFDYIFSGHGNWKSASG
jgi:hypothetical protein